ncbi:hypothetical protein L7F22_025287 [Adiantum nelumboides]|nr:hypothetical protein [Adiantum nelumboides]
MLDVLQLDHANQATLNDLQSIRACLSATELWQRQMVAVFAQTLVSIDNRSPTLPDSHSRFDKRRKTSRGECLKRLPKALDHISTPKASLELEDCIDTNFIESNLGIQESAPCEVKYNRNLTPQVSKMVTSKREYQNLNVDDKSTRSNHTYLHHVDTYDPLHAKMITSMVYPDLLYDEEALFFDGLA